MIRRACATLALFLAVAPSAIVHAEQGSDLRGTDTYVVQAGDTLNNIASRTGVDLDTLVRVNHLTGADTIYAGSVLRLRDTGSSVQTIAGNVQPNQTIAGTTAPLVAAASAPVQGNMQMAGPPPGLNGVAIPLTVNRPVASIPSQNQGPSALVTMPASPATSNALAAALPRGDASSLLPPSSVPLSVQFAVQFLGSPYQYGGSSPSGFDCSGFVYFVEGRAGRTVPRDLTGQYDAGMHPTGTLLPGDLVFFQDTYEAGLSHVGIYLGNGQFVHALDEDRGVAISSLTESFYATHWYGATRLP